MNQQPYQHQHYPKTLFHPTLGSKVVQNTEQHLSLGDEWAEVPFPVEAKQESDESSVETAGELEMCPKCVEMKQQFDVAWDAKVEELKAATTEVENLRAESAKQAKLIAKLEKQVAAASAKKSPKGDVPAEVTA